MKTLLLTTTAALLTAGAASAQSTEINPEVYGSVGYTYADFDDAGFDVATLRGGVDLNDYFGVEAEAGFGLSAEDISGVAVELDTLWGTYAKAQYPLTEQFDAFARIGYVDAEVEGSLAGTTVSVGDDGVGYGVGGQYWFAGKNGVRGEYTRYDFDEGEADAFTLSYVRKF